MNSIRSTVYVVVDRIILCAWSFVVLTGNTCSLSCWHDLLYLYSIVLRYLLVHSSASIVPVESIISYRVFFKGCH